MFTRHCRLSGWLLVLLFSGSLLHGQPVNDLCLNAAEIFDGIPVNGTTVAATGTDITSCADDDYNDVWYVFHPLTNGSYIISLCDLDVFDTTLAVFGSCGGAEIACNDDSCGFLSQLSVTLTGGNSYHIRVAGYLGDSGPFELTAAQVSIPPHDACVGAIALTEGVVHSDTTAGATSTLPSSCADNASDELDVWHTFTPTITADYHISLCGSSFDTTLALYDGCVGNQLACNDDACGLQSEITQPLTANTTYFIRVAGYDQATGTYDILVEQDICELPAAVDQPHPADNGKMDYIDSLLSWFDFTPAPAKVGKSLAVPKIIYGNDDRLEDYQVTNVDVRAIGDATVVLVNPSALSDNGDGTFDLDNTSFADDYFNRTGTPLCPSEPYFDQPAPGWCSGFLVGPDTVATAGHCITDSSDCADVAFVFGFVMAEPNEPALTFDTSQIYFCSEIIDRVEDGSSDWSLIRLDRAVPDHTPIPLRQSGQIALGESLILIGHPQGLPRKYAAEATVRENSNPDYFQANLDAYGGNSGSLALNAVTLQAEGILVRGNPDFVSTGSCDASNTCPDSGCPGWEEVTRATEFSDQIPRFDVYLGTDPNDLTLICADTTQFWCDPGPLACGTRYYWQVTQRNACGQTPGPVWSFVAIRSDLPADLNANCLIDYGDFAVFQLHWMSGTCGSGNQFCGGADADESGDVDLTDLYGLYASWLAGVAP